MKRQNENKGKAAAKVGGKMAPYGGHEAAACQPRESDEYSRESNLNCKDYVEDLLIEKMCIYMAKMALHDEALSQQKPSLIAVGSIYVALKICEQLKKKSIITS